MSAVSETEDADLSTDEIKLKVSFENDYVITGQGDLYTNAHGDNNTVNLSIPADASDSKGGDINTYAGQNGDLTTENMSTKPNNENTMCSLASAEHYNSSKRDEAVRIRFGEDDLTGHSTTTVMQSFERTVQNFPDKPALKQEREGKWVTWTYGEYLQDVKTAAKAFIKLGLEPYHGVGILGFNSPEWVISDVAAIFACGFAVGIYTTNTPEACRYVASNSKANVAIVENDVQLNKLLEVWEFLPDLKAIIVYKELKDPGLKKDNVYTWNEMLEIGKQTSEDLLNERLKMQVPNRCCTLIYTSGTTGNPKGVMLSHDNVTYMAECIKNTVKDFRTPDGEVMISYLPLSHIAAQITDIHAPIAMNATVWFARADALKGSLGETLRTVRPTLFLGVPRVFEKIQEMIKSIGESLPAMKKKISRWAKDIALRGNMNKEEGRPVPYGWTIANGLILKRVRNQLGLNRCRCVWTAAAPTSLETLRYFQSLNIPLLEIYGMSECTGGGSVSLPAVVKTGAVGKAVKGTSIKIANQDQDGSGEICFRGRHVFIGYLENDEKTKEALDDEGWLHSGDVGKFDEDGFLYITGRIKELIITAGGENIAPVPIEDNIKSALPIVSNAMVIGDRRKFLSVLLTLKTEADAETGEPIDKLSRVARKFCKDLGLDVTNASEITTNVPEALSQAIQNALNEANEKAVSRAARVQKFQILPKDFSVGGGELGPTLKLRRPHVVKAYTDVIESFYTD